MAFDDTVAAPQAGDGWGWILAYGIVSVVVGLLALAWPFAATYAAVVVIGVFLLVTGAMAVAAALFGRGHHARGYTAMFGIASLVIGLIMVFDTAAGAISLTLLVTIWLVVSGVLDLMLGLRARQHRALLIVVGIVDLLLAVYVIATLPLSALTLPGVVLAISFVFGGASSIIQALAHRRGAHAFTT